MNFQISEKLKNLPPYLFAEIDIAKRRAIAAGEDIIDLGVGDPDLPTPKFVVDEMKEALEDVSTHQYPSGAGLSNFRQSVAKWYKKRFKVDLNPNNEILPLIGSKEGVAHLPLAFINKKDVVLIPDPCYPPYIGGTVLAGGEVYRMPLLEEEGFLPNLSKIPKAVVDKAKLMFINYPNNPTGAVADMEFFSRVVSFAEKNNIIVAHDAAYSEVSFNGYKPLSFLECKNSKSVGVEFHSLSKTFNMTGWRIGWLSGNKSVIQGLLKVKSNIDSGVFNAIQKVGVVALENKKGNEHVKIMQEIYSKRQKVMVEGLRDTILNAIPTKATFYLWCSIAGNVDSTELTKKLLRKAGVVVTPGIGLGPSGEGYIRISLTASENELQEAVDRIKKHFG